MKLICWATLTYDIHPFVHYTPNNLEPPVLGTEYKQARLGRGFLAFLRLRIFLFLLYMFPSFPSMGPVHWLILRNICCVRNSLGVLLHRPFVAKNPFGKLP